MGERKVWGIVEETESSVNCPSWAIDRESVPEGNYEVREKKKVKKIKFSPGVPPAKAKKRSS